MNKRDMAEEINRMGFKKFLELIGSAFEEVAFQEQDKNEKRSLKADAISQVIYEMADGNIPKYDE